ncbi:MAG: MFS transporter [Candidatus Omnitrophica bacterium]|nr:MFS transporter [Candidatus Omnitrophota bacterium]MDD5653118.1 MFS transporter [Candidatus Omnitrophota bacterium]
MTKFTKVLKNRNFFLLWVGQIISQVGDRLDQMALIAFISSREGTSTLDIAKILSFTIIPVFIIGPLAGAYVDRWDRRRTMFISDLLRAALVFTIPFFFLNRQNLIPVYLIVFIIFSIGRFFVPAKMSIIPDLVDKKDILIANSLVNTTGMIAAILGFGVSGIIVEWLKARGGFYLDAFSFLASGTCIYFISRRSSIHLGFKEVGKEIVEVIRKSVLAEMKDGILYFMRKKDIRFTAAITFVLFSALGSVYVVVIVFVQQTLNSITKDLGLLVMFLGIGLFVGSLLYGRFGQRVSHYKSIFTSLILSGVMLIAFAAMLERYPSFQLAALLAFWLGLSIAPIMIASNTIIHNASESEMRGKIFSSLEIVMHLGFLLFMLLSSYLAERVAPVLILVTVGGIIGIVGIISLIYHRRIPWLE